MSRIHLNPAIQEVVQRVKPLLMQYLQEHGVAAMERGKFRCFNPEHPDNTPSMNFIPKSNGTKVKCQSCGASYDIFDAHAIFEKRPKMGPGWIYQNVYDLARRYGIEFTEVEPTEAEIHLMALMRMFQDAADTLEDMIHEKPQEYLEHCLARGIKHETCFEFVCGTVPWRVFLQKMKACGHDAEFMKKYDLSDEMFGQRHITIVLRDKNGMVVGFARRWLDFDEQQAKLLRSQNIYYPPKYLNTSANVPFFQKEALLFNLDKARKENFRRAEVFEGYFDVMSAWQAGVKTATCSCGSAVTEFHIIQLQDCGFSHVNFVGDQDKAGQTMMSKALDMCAGREGLRATVTFLTFHDGVPEKDRDPDGFFRWYGLDAYLKLQEVSGFDWKLWSELQQATWDPYQVAKKMVPLILNERDRIERGRLIRTLAERTKVTEEDIRGEILQRENRQIDEAADELQLDLRRARDSTERADAVRRALDKVQEVQTEKVDVSVGESARAAADAFLKFETPVQGMRGWDTGWDIFNKDYDGLPKEQEVFGLAGAPSSGKSALATNLTVNLVLKNEKGLSVVYHIMDDPRTVAYAKILSCLTGLPIQMVLRAGTDILPFEHLARAYRPAKEWMLTAMNEGRLVIKGQEMGAGTDTVTRLIDTTTQRTGRKLVYIADSLHNLEDDQGSEDRRNRFANVASWSQQVSDTRRITMILTCELTKEGMRERPKLYQTGETGKIAYAFKAIGMVWNEMQGYQDNAKLFWVDDIVDPRSGARTGQVKRPIIEVHWQKNKITGVRHKHYFRLWDHTARATMMTREELDVERQKAASAQLGAPNVDALGSFAAAMPYARPIFEERR
jgi:DNA primase catalytic core